jgi:DNA primase large subunit
MDDRVKKAVFDKIQETISNTDEISKIQQMLSYNMAVTSLEDLMFGIAIGRIYNSFHYQTRRALKRNATKKEFEEFLDILAKRADTIKNALKQQQQQ